VDFFTGFSFELFGILEFGVVPKFLSRFQLLSRHVEVRVQDFLNRAEAVFRFA
jgi:hypothetical protein